MEQYTILVADDEKEIRDAIDIYLRSEGFKVIKVKDGLEAIEKLETEPVHLVILDVMMPRMDGINACMQIREEKNIPIIMVSAKSEDRDKILGLNIGADDYVVKPFNHLELVARVKSQLRRYDKPLDVDTSSQKIKIKDLIIDTVNKSVILRNEEIRLTATEYKILVLLASNTGRIFSIKEIYEKVWKEVFYKSENTVTVHIRRMREKLEVNSKNPEYIKVVWGIGYKMDRE